MPEAINNNLTSLVQSLVRLTETSDARQAERIAAQATSAETRTNGTDRVDLTASRELSPRMNRAVKKAQRSQTRIEEAQTARRTLDSSRTGLSEMRSIARQASSADITSAERAALAERFNALQTQINTDTQNAAFRGTALNERLFAQRTSSGDGANTRVRITGTGVADGRTVEEENVGIGLSQIAREAGLREVRLDEDGAEAVFRFQDTGGGMVTVTRFDVTDEGLEEAGTQTVALQNYRSGAMTAGSSETLNFDRLGLQVELDEGYTSGDLNRVETRVQTPVAEEVEEAEEVVEPAPAEEGDADEAAGPAALTLDIADADSAAYAARRLDVAINRADRLENATRNAESNARRNVSRAFGDMAAEGFAGLNVDMRAIERELRTMLLDGV